MTEHLPECLHDDRTYGLHGLCICQEIERAVQRVTQRWESLRGWGESYGYKTGSDNGFDAGYAAALDAAREAAFNTRGWFTDEYPNSDGIALPVALIEDVVNRIDALKEKP